MKATRNANAQTLKHAFDARDQEITMFKELLAKKERERDELAGQLIKWKADAGEALATVDVMRRDIDALKGELAAAHAVMARQAGYLDRVREDDELGDPRHWEDKPAVGRDGPRVPPQTLSVPRELRSHDEGGYSIQAVERSAKPWWAR